MSIDFHDERNSDTMIKTPFTVADMNLIHYIAGSLGQITDVIQDLSKIAYQISERLRSMMTCIRMKKYLEKYPDDESIKQEIRQLMNEACGFKQTLIEISVRLDRFNDT